MLVGGWVGASDMHVANSLGPQLNGGCVFAKR